jgi:hypothetical protein
LNNVETGAESQRFAGDLRIDQVLAELAPVVVTGRSRGLGDTLRSLHGRSTRPRTGGTASTSGMSWASVRLPHITVQAKEIRVASTKGNAWRAIPTGSVRDKVILWASL